MNCMNLFLRKYKQVHENELITAKKKQKSQFK